MQLAAGAYVGPYQIRSFIGAGGMGEVYAAHDGKLQRVVALKVLPERFASRPDRLIRFQREARVLATLSHPNIAAIYDFHDADGVNALVLELVDGPTLADRIDNGPIALDEALSIGRQIARALEAAHDHGIIHRDLKPSNIKLRPDGAVKLLDFGLAKAVDPLLPGHGPEESTLTDGPRIGTPAYMAPEQARGLAVDRRADVWSFGCVLFEMLTGKRPFETANARNDHTSFVTTEPDWALLPAGVPATVRIFLEGCLQVDPGLRVRDIGDVRLALEGSLGASTLIQRRHEAVSQRTASRWAIALAGVALASLAGFVAAYRFGGVRNDPAVSFLLSAPDGGGFPRTTSSPYPALSFDGDRLAFVAPFESSPVIWIQTLGETRALPLRGSEESTYPFWSPDGQSVGFISQGRLRRIAVSGEGTPRDICVCTPRFGATWTPDGTIVFAASDGLFQVSSDGGEPVALTQLDKSKQESSHQFPVVLPDGRRFLYLIRGPQPEIHGVYIGSLDDEAIKRRVLADDSNVAYGVDGQNRGHLFFVRSRTLLAQRFDAASGNVIGEAVVVRRPIVPGEGARFAAFAAGGRTLLYRRWIAPQDRLLWVDRRGTRQRIIGPERVDYDYVALSPDASQAAIALRDWGTGARDLFVVNTETGVSDRFTFNSPEAGFPQWAPDGSRIIYASAQRGTWDLHWRSLNGGGEHYLFEGAARPPLALPEPNYARDISADGRYLLFGGYSSLWLAPLADPAQARRLMGASDGRVSPNGRWLAYSALDAGKRQVYVTTFPEPNGRRRISIDGGQDPQWRRDGKELYYVAADRTLVAVPVETEGTFAAGVPDLLFRPSFDPQSVTFGSAYAPAPDGQRFLIIDHMQNDDPLLVVTLNWTRFDGARSDGAP
jgi:eukaryotic-like serine/threonine-protein kinase